MHADMTTKELRELKEWVAEHVAGYSRCSHPNCSSWHHPTTGSSCQLPEMDDADFVLEVLKKCVDKISWSDGIVIDRVPSTGVWLVGQEESKEEGGEAETIELAIFKFAKKLWEGK